MTISIGNKYSSWTVIDFCDNRSKVTCKCKCGTIRDVWRAHLKNSASRSCGCKTKYDLEGNIRGKVKVLSKTNKRHPKDGSILWKCKCECGNHTLLPTSRLRSGAIVSCGCYTKRKVPIGYSAKKNTFAVYKRCAKKRNINFDINFDKFIEIISQNCAYCGAKSSNVSKNPRGHGDFTYTGLDRVDNSKGYTTINATPCCKICNTAKSTMTVSEFQKWITQVYKRFHK